MAAQPKIDVTYLDPELFPPPIPWENLTAAQKFDRMGSWFLGNHGENSQLFQQSMASIINLVTVGRQGIWPGDPRMITEVMQQSEQFQDSVKNILENLEPLASLLTQHSVPFYSPRYAGHMVSDISLPAVLGFALAQQFNQNNVTPEASSITSVIELSVGQKLCHILGYNTPGDALPAAGTSDPGEPISWGHITADGSIANLESIWIARNLKYYPLSLKLAIGKDLPLSFVASTFKITLCDGTTKLFNSCDTWELLNLAPTTIAEIPERLYQEYNISSAALSDALTDFSIQTIGLSELNKRFGITQPAQYMVSVTNHYSWPKGCAITGIGSENLVQIGVDLDVRMDVVELRRELESRLERKQAVFCAVVVCGTTETGSVDPVEQVVLLREELNKKGMSFMIHADAAWGGYFACKVRPPARSVPKRDYAFSIPLNVWTNKQLGAIRHADTVTIDPHKSGYIPYPAGALCMRDNRLRFLTTWTSPYINTDMTADINMGTYGVEGSKPGAAAVAVWLSHHILGLDSKGKDSGGYASLLGTAMLTGIKMYGHWATIDLVADRLIIAPVNRLPVERGPTPPTEDQLRAQKEEILRKIARRPNSELEHDPEAMALVSKLGSDTMINAFVCNFKINGRVNTDIDQSNFLNDRLYERLSVRTPRDVINDKPILITRTEFKQSVYGDMLRSLKSRLGVDKSSLDDVVVLSNVSMNPFPTVGTFLAEIVDQFIEVADEEITNCLVRIEERPAVHGFTLQGPNILDTHLVYLPMFHVRNHQRQLTLRVKIEGPADLESRIASSRSALTVHTSSKTLQDLKTLDELIRGGSFVADIYEGFPSIYSQLATHPSTAHWPIRGVRVTISAVRIDQSLQRANLDLAYPGGMPFYLYTSVNGLNIDHVLSKAPNAQLSAAGVTLRSTAKLDLDPSKLYKVTLDDYKEWSMQPFSTSQRPEFFSPGNVLNVTVRANDDPLESSGTAATLALPSNPRFLSIDPEFLNHPIAADTYITPLPATPRDAEQVKKDIDLIALRLAKAFQDGDIKWTDNVIHSLRKLYPLAKSYSVTLGIPAERPGEDAYFAIVSRYVSEHSANPKMQAFARNQEWLRKLVAKKGKTERDEYAGGV